jgi:hypothetical protein
MSTNTRTYNPVISNAFGAPVSVPVVLTARMDEFGDRVYTTHDG